MRQLSYLLLFILFTQSPVMAGETPVIKSENQSHPENQKQATDNPSIDRHLSVFVITGTDNGLGLAVEGMIGNNFRLEGSFSSPVDAYFIELSAKQLFTVSKSDNNKHIFRMGFGFGIFYAAFDRPTYGYERMKNGELTGFFARPNIEFEYSYLQSKSYSSVLKLQVGIVRNTNDDQKWQYYKHVEYKPDAIPLSIRVGFGFSF